MNRRSDDKHARPKIMELKKRSLQCPICHATYIRKDNLLRHSKKIHSENIAARMPTKEDKKSQTLSVRLRGI